VFTLTVAGLARSMEVFAIGGTVLVGLDFAIKHANAVDPNTHKMAGAQEADQSESFPMPDYQS
jgi:hypothetical protein